jgi:hypothetical protein
MADDKVCRISRVSKFSMVNVVSSRARGITP